MVVVAVALVFIADWSAHDWSEAISTVVDGRPAVVVCGMICNIIMSAKLCLQGRH
jgi:hypothetical protein